MALGKNSPARNGVSWLEHSFAIVSVAKHILCISFDASLLLTRKLLLEQQGYTVVTADTFEAACNACAAEPENLGLVILGHSIPRSDKEKIIAQVRQECRAPILALLRPHESSVRGADASVEGDPSMLVAAVRRLLG